MRRRVLGALLIALVTGSGLAPAVAGPGGGARIEGLRGPGTVAQYARFETAAAAISPAPANPFDPAQADVRAHYRSPSGRTYEIPAFWYQGFTRSLVAGREVLTPTDEVGWRARFSPPEPGAWTWWWTARTPAGETASRSHAVKVTPSTDPGFVRRSAQDSRYLVRDDGSPWFAVGENVGWYDARGTFAYDAWYARLAEQGANYARLWMPSWAFGLEWKDTGLGNYDQRLDRAWQLDHVIELGERLGISHMLSLLNHGAFSQTFNSEWADNPYNAARGGPLDQPGQVFVDEEAKELLRRRFRYIVARWGYSTGIMAWELWNEADHVTPYAPGASLAWHREMADYLRAIDPHDHLVSTSFALGPSDGSVWAAAGLDFTQFHYYSRFADVPPEVEAAGGSRVGAVFPDIARNMTTWMPAQQAAYQRPVLFAEFGVDSRGPAQTERWDPNGYGLHDGLWAAPMGGTFGTGMTWWWDNYVDPKNLYPMFGSVARFLAGVRWHEEGFAPTAASAHALSRPLATYGLTGRTTALLWVKNDQHQWTTPDPSTVADATLVTAGLGPGRWCGHWYDTWAGARRGAVQLTGGPVPTSLAVPPFRFDLALRLQAC